MDCRSVLGYLSLVIGGLVDSGSPELIDVGWMRELASSVGEADPYWTIILEDTASGANLGDGSSRCL